MIYSASPVNVTPEVTLSRWRIMKMQQGQYLAGDEIVNGMYVGGRASTKIISIDKINGIAITKSGRVYQLLGEEFSTLSRDAQYVWDGYKRINKLTELEESKD